MNKANEYILRENMQEKLLKKGYTKQQIKMMDIKVIENIYYGSE